jgi:hypothetical protein
MSSWNVYFYSPLSCSYVLILFRKFYYYFSEKEIFQAGVADSCSCMWVYLERLRSSKGRDHEHANIFYDRNRHDGALLPPAAALAPILWPNFFLRWGCPPETNAKDSFSNSSSSYVQGGELENECRVLAQSYNRLKKVRCSKVCVSFVCNINLFLFMEIFLDIKWKQPFFMDVSRFHLEFCTML